MNADSAVPESGCEIIQVWASAACPAGDVAKFRGANLGYNQGYVATSAGCEGFFSYPLLSDEID